MSLFSMGSAGDPPAPLGDSPSGTGESQTFNKGVSARAVRLPIPSGGSPDGTGKSPVLPTLNTDETVGYKSLRDKSAVADARGFPLAKGAGPPHLRTMQSHELLREVFQQTSPKQVSSDLGLSLSLIYKWAEPPDNAAGSGSSNPLDRIEALLRSTNDPRIVQWLCERAGGFFIRNPKTHNPHPDYLIPATNEIIQEFADLLAVIASAAADSHVSAEEARKIRARWEELKGVTETFVRCCEEGNFRPLKDKPPTLNPAPRE